MPSAACSPAQSLVYTRTSIECKVVCKVLARSHTYSYVDDFFLCRERTTPQTFQNKTPNVCFFYKKFRNALEIGNTGSRIEIRRPFVFFKYISNISVHVHICMPPGNTNIYQLVMLAHRYRDLDSCEASVPHSIAMATTLYKAYIAY